MLKRIYLILLVMTTTLCGQSVLAKNLAHRLGVGFKDQFGVTNMPAIAAQYYPYDDLGFSASLAVNTETNNSGFGLMIKLYKLIFMEEHLNFYMGSGVGLLSKETSGVSSSGFELSGYVGGEFFLMGLDSLGFSFETGVGVTSISNGTKFRTIGDSPVRAGITFYF